jgi:polysaccharide biosynthesis transport protein
MIRILLVDDQKTIREALKVALSEEADFTLVGTASDGYTAIEQVSLLKPDVVLMDLEMPDLNGVDATQIICQRFSNIKILVLSSHDDEEWVRRSLQAGAVGYLLKETPIEELKEGIRFVHQGYTHIGRELLNKVVSKFTPSVCEQSATQEAPLDSVPDSGVLTPSVAASPAQANTSNPWALAHPAEPVLTVTPLETAASGGGLGDLLAALRRYWMPAIAIAAVVATGSAFRTLREVPKYQSEAVILVDTKASVPVVSANETPGGTESARDLSTEIRILKSRGVIARALSQLKAPYNSLTADQVIPNLSLSLDSDASLLVVSYVDTDPQRAKAVLDRLAASYVQYSSERQRSRATNAIRFIEVQLPKARRELNETALAISEFQRRHNIVDPTSYAESAFAAKQDLHKQVSETERSLNQTARQQNVLKAQITQLGQDPKTAAIDATLSQDTTYQDRVKQLRELEAQYALESTRLQPEHPLLQTLNERRTEMYRLLQNQVQRLLGGRSSQVARQTSVSGGIQQTLVTQLLQTQLTLATQAAQLKGLRQAEGQAALVVQQVPLLQREYAELQRRHTFSSGAVDKFLSKLQELRIAEAQETSPWKVLEAAFLPGAPISPNINKGLMSSLAMGLAAAVGTAWLLNRLDQRVKAVEEATELSGLALFGRIPRYHVKSLMSKLKQGNGQSLLNPFTESVRSLALTLVANFPVQTKALGGKLIALTSATPGEGKTTITAHLGLALAELGYRVLVVDMDMRRPTLHRVFGVSNIAGLSTAITTERPWYELVKSIAAPASHASQRVHIDFSTANSAVGPAGQSLAAAALPQPLAIDSALSNRSSLGLPHQVTSPRCPDIITSGPQLPNSLPWLTSQKMLQHLEWWRQAYDFVLLDVPPIVGIADTQSIAPRVDGMFLVVGVERATRQSVVRGVETLRRIHSNVMGVVANFVSQKDEEYHYQRYYGSSDRN